MSTRGLAINNGTALLTRFTPTRSGGWATITFLQGSSVDEGAYSPAQDVTFSCDSKDLQHIIATLSAVEREMRGLQGEPT